jgi:broad specificity phosphatase PhoE
MPPIVWLVRHAHRLDFIQPEWFETAPFPYDPPLSALGWQQSLELVSKFQNSHIQQIWASPHLRTIQTAYPLAQSLGLSIKVEYGLREWLNPLWSKSLPEILPTTELAARGIRVNEYYQSQCWPIYPETMTELMARTALVTKKAIIPSHDSVLIVAHKNSLAGIVAALTGKISVVQELEILPASVIALTTADPERASGSWQIIPPDSIFDIHYD